MRGLKLRLAAYSIFGKRSYKEYKEAYREKYEQIAKVKLQEVYESTLKDIIKSGYNIRIATKNVCAKNLLEQQCFKEDVEIKEKLKLIVLLKDKKRQFKELINKYDNKVCVIGNNLSDDIINSCKIGSPFIYIGKSIVVKFIIKIINKLNKNCIYKRGIQLDEITKIRSIFTK